MKRAGWILLGSLLVASAACAQQAGTPAGSSAAASAAAEVAPPAHPATEAQIREYLSLVGAEKMAHEVMDAGAKAMQTTSAPYFPADFWTDLREELRKVDVTTVYVKVYQRYMSQEDMQAVIDFYRSPAGKRLLEAQPLAIRDAQVIMGRAGQQIGETVYARHKDEIEAAKKRFDAGQAKPEIDLTPAPK